MDLLTPVGDRLLPNRLSPLIRNRDVLGGLIQEYSIAA